MPSTVRWVLLLRSITGAAAVGYLDALERAGVPVNRVSSGSRRHWRIGSPRALTVTTIHQAKGREWDVVIVGSLGFDNADVDPVGRELGPYCKRPAFEPAGRIAAFEHARQHYVAFSRRGVCWRCRRTGASPLRRRLGPPAPLESHGPEGFGSPAFATAGADRGCGAGPRTGAGHSIPEAPGRMGGVRRGGGAQRRTARAGGDLTGRRSLLACH